MRTSRIRTTALAAVTAALALGLTACGGADGDSKAAGGDNAAGTAQSRSASEGDGKGAAEQIESKSTTVGAQQCRGDELLVTAVHRFAGQQGDHLLVTASNEGTKPCWVTSYPAVKLGDDAAVLPHSKKDNPGGDKHITLRPGGKVYSAVNLFDYGSRHQTAQSLAIALRGADGHQNPYYSVVMKGEKQRFSWNEADVLNWSTEKPYDF
ncbi:MULTISPECIES: DUF4232 domain-containing protein [Streptomyces]|uniref:DUF4232 domain-containing protein n=1 Tax=Streptomyces TaxID=1883 RepID=UPI000766F46A|nr:MULTISPECIES: DUF4232 domain-containing protein [Streptomyces]MBW8093901.1 DUF4232 domain-containing protein [Streptomyces hygroscopicus subsp. hygroscopicus]MCO8305477.1 DUF4232 domain-containing protein [Streptomyces sp. RKCA744]MDN3061148.1 DUF4232 domain-containing protein [Streptomyces sp. SRF1]